MAIKIEKCTIEIKGKKVNFLKPTAIDIIEVEDKCFGANGTINPVQYKEEMLKLISNTLKSSDLVEFVPQAVKLSSGDELSIPEIGYDVWVKTISEIEGFSRVKLAKQALLASGLSGVNDLSGFKYEDIDSLAMAFFSLYDNSELDRVVDELITFCQ
jgi:hypothetical protein